MSEGRLRGAQLSRKADRFCFDLTRVFVVFVCLTSLRLTVGPFWSCLFLPFEDRCFTHESAQACFAFARSTAGCQEGIRSQLECLEAAAQFCCVCFRGLKSFTSREKPSEAQKPNFVWLKDESLAQGSSSEKSVSPTVVLRCVTCGSWVR